MIKHSDTLPHFAVREMIFKANPEGAARRYLDRYPVLKLSAVSRMARANGASAADWLRQNRIFAIQHNGFLLFPAFQFRDGRPHPAIGRAIAAFPSRKTAWQTALFFGLPHSVANGRIPATLLDDTALLLKAARRDNDRVSLAGSPLRACLGQARNLRQAPALAA